MTYTKRLMAQGQWSLKMKEDAPEQLIDIIDYAGHIVVTSERIDHEALSDADILDEAKYVGVVVRKPTADIASYGGFGLEWWLGSGGRGKVLRGATSIDWTNRGFSDAIGDVLTAPTPITKGSVETTAGTYTQAFNLKTQRDIIDTLTAAFGAEYRVNNDFTLDAGSSGYLFNGTPTAILALKIGGHDPNVDGFVVKTLSVASDIEEFTTTAIVAAEGTGETLITAEESLGDKLFLDPQGNDIDRSFVINEPSTTSANASDRAQAYLDTYGTIRKAVKLDLDEFDVKGKFEVGDLINVWNPRSQLTDDSNELAFRGQLLNPISIRVLAITDPFVKGNGVYYRSTATPPKYTDLSDYFVPESGSTKVEVGATSRNLVEGRSAVLDARISTDPDGNDVIGPDTPAHASTPWLSTTYLDSQGIRKSRIVAVWSTPTNTDASTVTDGSHYTVRYRQNGQTEYQYLSVDWGVNTCSINELAPGVVYEISVSASDVNGNTSSFGSDESVTAAQASGVPSQPSVPTVAGNVLNIQVVHDLTANGGGNLESDLDHLVVYGTTSSGFTPSSANRLGEITATAAHINLGISVVGTFPLEDTSTRYIVVTAVDREGNESAPSPEATVTAELIDTQHITNLAVTTALIDNLAVTDAKILSLTADKLTAGEIDASVIDVVNINASEINTGTLNASVVSVTNLNASNITTGTLSATRIGAGTIGVEVIKLSNSSSSRIESNDGTSLIIRGNGTFVATSATISGAITATSGSITGPMTISGTLTMSGGGIIRTASSGARVELGAGANIDFRGTTGSSVGTIYGSSGGALYIQGASSGPIYILNHGYDVFLGSDLSGNPGYWLDDSASAHVWKIGGAEKAYLYTNGLVMGGRDTGDVYLGVAGGYSFWGDTDTYMQRYGANEIGWYLGARLGMRIKKGTTYCEFRVPDAYTVTQSASTLTISSSGLIRRTSSARKYKKFISARDDLYEIELQPVQYKAKKPKGDPEYNDRWNYSLVADDLVEQDPTLGLFSEGGEVEDFVDRAVLAVLAAKVNHQRDEIGELRDEIRKLQEEIYGRRSAA